MFGLVNTGIPSFCAINNPFVTVAFGHGLHMRGIGTMLWFGNTKGKSSTPLSQRVNPLSFLLVCTVLDHQQQPHVIADYGVFVL